MDRFVDIDLSQLPPPQLIEEISSEAIIAALKTWILARWEVVRQTRPDLPPIDTLGLETEPLTILIECFAYRETLMRALVNDKARAVLLAYAVGTDLEHIGALYAVARMEGEADDRLRRRIQLAPEAFSVAGPAGAYEFHALTLTTAIADAHAFTPDAEKGRVRVVLAGPAGADVSDGVVAAVVARFRDDSLVPLTDVVQVVRAERVPYTVAAELIVERGPDATLLVAAAEQAIAAHVARRCRIATNVYRSALIAAAQVSGVRNIILHGPAADVICGPAQIPVATGITVTTTIV